MRFTVAIAVLTETISSVVSSSSSSTTSPFLRSSASSASSSSSSTNDGSDNLFLHRQQEQQERRRRHLTTSALKNRYVGNNDDRKQTIYPECTPNINPIHPTSSTIIQNGESEEQQQHNRPLLLLRNAGDTSINNGSHQSMTSNTADVGVLSCGVGQYCAETGLDSSFMSSGMGGVCVNEKNFPLSSSSSSSSSSKQRSLQDHLQGMFPTAQHHDQQATFLHRALEDATPDETVSALIDVMHDLCYSNKASIFDGCKCTDMNLATYSGSIDCWYDNACFNATTFCGEELEFCFSKTYSLTVLDPTADAVANGAITREATICGHLTGNMPSGRFINSTSTSTSTGNGTDYWSLSDMVDFQYCYDVSSNSTSTTCESMTINGDQQCGFCIFPIGDGNTRVCKEVTCGDTDLQFSGTFCEQDVKDLFLQYNVLAPIELPCPNGGCNLCGEDSNVYMGYPSGIVTLEGAGNYTYGELELAALTGSFDAETCILFEDAVIGVCGCPPPVLFNNLYNR